MAMQGAAATGAAVPTGAMVPTIGGALGITPAPSPGGTANPTGVSPTAKRPRNPDNVAMDQGGFTTMSLDDLTTGFHNLTKLEQRDYKSILEIGQCVMQKKLLNSTIVKLNAIDAGSKLMNQSIEQGATDLRFGLTKTEELVTERKNGLRRQPVSYTHLTLPTNREV